MSGCEAAGYPQGAQLMFELSPDYDEIIMIGGRDPRVLRFLGGFVGHPIPVDSFEVVRERIQDPEELEAANGSGEQATVVSELALDFEIEKVSSLLYSIAAAEKSLKYKITAEGFAAFALGTQYGKGRQRDTLGSGDFAARYNGLTIMSSQGTVWTELPPDYYDRKIEAGEQE